MSLPSFLERLRRGVAAGGAPAQRARSASVPDVEALRTQARRRLIGMAVLVGLGVLGFPWLFETQPRPMSADVRVIQSPSVAPAASSRTAAGRIATPVDAGADARVAAITPPPEAGPLEGAVAASAAPAQREEPAQKPPATKPPVQKPSPPSTDKPPVKTTEKASEKSSDKPGTRYVVQFGAFADAGAARETRQKAERLGLKTYAQQVDTPAGKRVRVRLGPFASRSEAEKALATLRRGGLSGAILTL